MTKTYDISFRTLTAMIFIIMASACSPDWEDGMEIDGAAAGGNYGGRTETEEQRKVLLLYSAGYNSLREYLLDDIRDLSGGWLPGRSRNDDILLVYTHTPEKRGAYGIPTSPYLLRLYDDGSGKACTDTLVTYSKGTISASAGQLNKVLKYVKDEFRARSYGMIFSSHATGYLPAGYYSFRNPESEYKFNGTGAMAMSSARTPFPVPYIEPEHDPSLPMVKSVGQDQVGTSGSYLSYEMEISDFAEAIPMKLDYILFDACLMGGVETAMELQGVCGKVGFSQAEVLAEGLDYKTLTQHLLQNKEADPRAVCEDYFNQYDVQSGVYRSATISLIDCDRMESLTKVCRDIFQAHREELGKINPGRVQRFYRSSKHWFYDLESVIIEAGATQEELDALHSALDECVIYKGHTPEFMSEFKITTFSGLSMYLPCNGGRELDKYYRTLSWNKATELVEY